MTMKREIGLWSRLLSYFLGMVEIALGIWAVIEGSRLFGPAAFTNSYRSTGEAWVAVGSLFLASGICTVFMGLFPRSKVVAFMSAICSMACFIAALALLGLSFGEGWNTSMRSIALVHWGLTVGGILINMLKLPIYFHLHM